jgi:hypothetical protein
VDSDQTAGLLKQCLQAESEFEISEARDDKRVSNDIRPVPEIRGNVYRLGNPVFGFG